MHQEEDGGGGGEVADSDQPTRGALDTTSGIFFNGFFKDPKLFYFRKADLNFMQIIVCFVWLAILLNVEGSEC